MAEVLQDQYRVLFEHSADAMLIIDEGRFVDCNDATLKMLGDMSRSELFSTHPSQLSPSFQPDGVPSFDKANEMISMAIENGSHRFEWVHRKIDGTDFPVEVLLTAIPADDRTLLHVVWRDITQRKKTEEELRLSTYVMESTSEGIVVTDMDLKIIEVNPAYCKLLGYTRDEVIGRNAGFAKSGRHDAEFYKAIWHSIDMTGQWQGEIWDRKKSGEVFPIYLRLNVVRDVTGQPRFYTGLFSDISHQKKTEEQLEELAFYDPLTKLPNRTLFHQRLRQDLKNCRRAKKKLALLFIDLDRFKYINDSLGHSRGDLMLVAVGGRIQQAVRSMDTVARMGGDEFTVIITDLTDEFTAGEVAAKILKEVIQPVWIGEHEIIPHMSIGISLFPKDGENVEDLTRYADMAMYHAKNEGGDNFYFFRESMNKESQKRLVLENDMNNGLCNAQFVPYYQPIVDLRSGWIVGVEALARWHHPDRGLVMPDEFIPLAEESGLITTLGQQILQQACLQVKQWMDQHSQELTLAVNLSGRQFNSKELVQDIQGTLEEAGFSHGNLILEITESMMMGHVDRVRNQLDQLHATGIKLAIDDFGTGYSSLSYLQHFPLNSLKIDRSFVTHLLNDRNKRAIVKAIISMANAMDLDVVAEGVESREQALYLKQLDCKKVQGYYFSKPLPAIQFEKLLTNENSRFNFNCTDNDFVDSDQINSLFQ
ncbi:sensor domain-containing protein [Sedimenticola selenatireducens]|uniref:cyclic-guanylate-specific phosphodiesterase n=1 Tax=Sedimenticola selenatireducens TaxID=191960 RepID=A0A558DRP4_9GAMM|nr:bifunctional diguanylate cyclase/phosphodiesterase [Sedimenticola selenatireducens]TVO75848.1 EAL domain-containing protein [Sedimenticola selenatireducens]TVT63707.1 MAG: EAL domain-containing protein [Sedimenticola selenatireducens]